MRRKLDIVRVQADIVVGDDVSDPPDADHGMQMHPDGAQYFVTLATYFFAPLWAGSWYALIEQYRTRRTFKIFFI